MALKHIVYQFYFLSCRTSKGKKLVPMNALGIGITFSVVKVLFVLIVLRDSRASYQMNFENRVGIHSILEFFAFPLS